MCVTLPDVMITMLGIEKIRKETVYAKKEEKKAILSRLQKSKTLSKDAWLERDDRLYGAIAEQMRRLAAQAVLLVREAKYADVNRVAGATGPPVKAVLAKLEREEKLEPQGRPLAQGGQ